jgi:hypothetical protein
MPLTLERLNDVNSLLREEEVSAEARWVAAANEILSEMEKDFKFNDRQHKKAKEFIRNVFYGFLNNYEYLSATAIAFGFNYFDSRSDYSKNIFRVLKDHAKVSITAGASQSKSYSIGMWLLMDFCRDPEATKIQVASMNGTHLKNNLFAGMCNAIENSVIDLGLDTNIGGMRITRRGDSIQSSLIYGRSFPEKQTFTGRFKGFKPDRRSREHEKWGIQGRARIFLDEASQISPACSMTWVPQRVLFPVQT